MTWKNKYFIGQKNNFDKRGREKHKLIFVSKLEISSAYLAKQEHLFP